MRKLKCVYKSSANDWMLVNNRKKINILHGQYIEMISNVTNKYCYNKHNSKNRYILSVAIIKLTCYLSFYIFSLKLQSYLLPSIKKKKITAQRINKNPMKI